uniref:Uncharacterized protein n=1 Tax=Anguilla anguilla TaxID=7936 RepID=A0A0E9T9A7_ANGAN
MHDILKVLWKKTHLTCKDVVYPLQILTHTHSERMWCSYLIKILCKTFLSTVLMP